jgi:hypothetical protein
VLFMFRWFLKPDYTDIVLMKRLRKKYDRIFFFNGNAGGGIPRLELLDYVDFFFAKALYKDRSLYARDFYGDELYTEYYHQIYPDIVFGGNKQRSVCVDLVKLEKLRLYWNIGIGDFPKRQLRQRAGVWVARKIGANAIKPFHVNPDNSRPKHLRVLEKRRNLISARYRPIGDGFLDLHRNTFGSVINEHPRFLTGTISQSAYNTELSESFGVFSPFGWGELCFRDFEAITRGSLLLKPDVSHLETWPDVFIPEETYVPLSWDASDILEKAEFFLSHNKEAQAIVDNAWERYRKQVSEVEGRLEGILSLI